jgi:FLVCR family MFS transporter
MIIGMSDSETMSLVSSGSSCTYRLYPQRFYVLFVFFLLSFDQNLIWLTFSPIARNAEIYYGMSEATVDLLLNWQSILFIPCLPLAYILLNKKNGLRKCVILVAILTFISTILRVIPLIVSDSSSPNFHKISMPFLHAGHILNAVCYPLVTAPVSQLSCEWFGLNERTRATTIAIIANNFGGTIGYVTSPFIVYSPECVPRLLYIHLGLAFVACVLTLLYFPAHPQSPPSLTAEQLSHSISEQNGSWKTHMKNIWQCLRTPSFLLICNAGSLSYGIFNVWVGLYDVILKPQNYSEIQTGWFSFGSALSGNIGGLFFAALADTGPFRRSFKLLINISCICCFFSLVWFILMVPTYFSDQLIISSSATTIGLSLGLAGLFQGAGLPLFYEALAEIMFPLPESLSASILVQWSNIISLILLFIAPNRGKLVNLIVLVTSAISIIMISCARFTYKRRDEDEKIQSNKRISNHSADNIINETIYGTLSKDIV